MLNNTKMRPGETETYALARSRSEKGRQLDTQGSPLLYEELVQEIRPTGRLQLYYKDFWKPRDLKAMSIGLFQAPRETRRSGREE